MSPLTTFHHLYSMSLVEFYSHLLVYHLRKFSIDRTCPMILELKVCRNSFVESDYQTEGVNVFL